MLRINKVFMMTIGSMAISWLNPGVLAASFNKNHDIQPQKEVPNTFSDDPVINEVDHHAYWDNQVPNQNFDYHQIVSLDSMTEEDFKKRIDKIVKAIETDDSNNPEDISDPLQMMLISQINKDEETKNYTIELLKNPEFPSALYNLLKDNEAKDAIRQVQTGLERLYTNPNFMRMSEIFPENEKAMVYLNQLVSGYFSLSKNAPKPEEIIDQDEHNRYNHGDDNHNHRFPASTDGNLHKTTITYPTDKYGNNRNNHPRNDQKEYDNDDDEEEDDVENEDEEEDDENDDEEDNEDDDDEEDGEDDYSDDDQEDDEEIYDANRDTRSTLKRRDQPATPIVDPIPEFGTLPQTKPLSLSNESSTHVNNRSRAGNQKTKPRPEKPSRRIQPDGKPTTKLHMG